MFPDVLLPFMFLYVIKTLFESPNQIKASWGSYKSHPESKYQIFHALCITHVFKTIIHDFD